MDLKSINESNGNKSNKIKNFQIHLCTTGELNGLLSSKGESLSSSTTKNKNGLYTIDIKDIKSLEELGETLEDIIVENSLEKNWYTSEELRSMKPFLLSASKIADRKSRGEGIFYMRPCISQTLYFISVLKEKTNIDLNKLNLGIEMYSERNPKKFSYNIHAFIQINLSNSQQIIIDYAHDNQVFIYFGAYKNQSGNKNLKTENIIFTPSSTFNDDNTIKDIIIKSLGSNSVETDIKPNPMNLQIGTLNIQMNEESLNNLFDDALEHIINENDKLNKSNGKHFKEWKEKYPKPLEITNELKQNNEN